MTCAGNWRLKTIETGDVLGQIPPQDAMTIASGS